MNSEKRTVEALGNLDRLLDVFDGGGPLLWIRHCKIEGFGRRLLCDFRQITEREVVLLKTTLDCLQVLVLLGPELNGVESECRDAVDPVGERFILVEHLETDRQCCHCCALPGTLDFPSTAPVVSVTIFIIFTCAIITQPLISIFVEPPITSNPAGAACPQSIPFGSTVGSETRSLLLLRV